MEAIKSCTPLLQWARSAEKTFLTETGSALAYAQQYSVPSQQANAYLNASHHTFLAVGTDRLEHVSVRSKPWSTKLYATTIRHDEDPPIWANVDLNPSGALPSHISLPRCDQPLAEEQLAGRALENLT